MLCNNVIVISQEEHAPAGSAAQPDAQPEAPPAAEPVAASGSWGAKRKRTAPGLQEQLARLEVRRFMWHALSPLVRTVCRALVEPGPAPALYAALEGSTAAGIFLAETYCRRVSQETVKRLNAEVVERRALNDPTMREEAAAMVGARFRREEQTCAGSLAASRAAGSAGSALGGQRAAGSGIAGLSLEAMFDSIDTFREHLAELGTAGGPGEAARPAIASLIRVCSSACGVDEAGIEPTKKAQRELKAYNMVCLALSTIASADGDDASFKTPLGCLLQWHMVNASGASELASTLLEFFGPGVPSFSALREFATRVTARLRQPGQVQLDPMTTIIFVIDQFGKYKVHSARGGIELDERNQASVQNGLKTLLAAVHARQVRDGVVVNGHLHEQEMRNCPKCWKLWSDVAKEQVRAGPSSPPASHPHTRTHARTRIHPCALLCWLLSAPLAAAITKRPPALCPWRGAQPGFVKDLTSLSATARTVDGEAASEVETLLSLRRSMLSGVCARVCLEVFGQGELRRKLQSGAPVVLTAGDAIKWGDKLARRPICCHGMPAPLCIRWTPLHASAATAVVLAYSPPCCSQVALEDEKNTAAGAARAAAPRPERCPNECGSSLNHSRSRKCQACNTALLSLAAVKDRAAASGAPEPERTAPKLERRCLTRARVANGEPLPDAAAAAAAAPAAAAAAAAAAPPAAAADYGTSTSSGNVLELCMCEYVDPSTLEGSIRVLRKCAPLLLLYLFCCLCSGLPGSAELSCIIKLVLAIMRIKRYGIVTIPE